MSLFAKVVAIQIIKKNNHMYMRTPTTINSKSALRRRAKLKQAVVQYWTLFNILFLLTFGLPPPSLIISHWLNRDMRREKAGLAPTRALMLTARQWCRVNTALNQTFVGNIRPGGFPLPALWRWRPHHWKASHVSALNHLKNRVQLHLGILMCQRSPL